MGVDAPLDLDARGVVVPDLLPLGVDSLDLAALRLPFAAAAVFVFADVAVVFLALEAATAFVVFSAAAEEDFVVFLVADADLDFLGVADAERFDEALDDLFLSVEPLAFDRAVFLGALVEAFFDSSGVTTLVVPLSEVLLEALHQICS